MKRYTITCHYDMVITFQVIADNEGTAIQTAREQADRMILNSDAECIGNDQKCKKIEALPPDELRQMERQAVTEHVRKYIGWIGTDPQLKEDLAGIAYRGNMINWPHGALMTPADHPRREWLQNLFGQLADGEHPRQELYNRYARMVARKQFCLRYKSA